MDFGEWLSQNAVAIVLGLAAIAAGLWGARQWGNRHPRLLVTAEAFSLMRSREDGLEVTYKGQAVQRPYVTRVTLECRGSSDIAPANFETGDSFHLRFSEAEILAVTSSGLKHTITESHQEPTSRRLPVAKTSIEILPQHLAVKQPRTISIVTDGDPGDPQFVGALLNVRITNRPLDGTSAIRVGAVGFTVGLTGSIVLALQNASSWLFVLTLLLMGVGSFGILFGFGARNRVVIPASTSRVVLRSK